MDLHDLDYPSLTQSHDILYLIHSETQTVLAEKRSNYVFSSLHIKGNFVVGQFGSNLFVFDTLNMDREPKQISVAEYCSFEVYEDKVVLLEENSSVEVSLVDFIEEEKQSDGKDTFSKDNIVDKFINHKTSEDAFVSAIVEKIISGTENDTLLASRILEECPIQDMLLKLKLLQHLYKHFPDLVRSSFLNHQTFYICFTGASHSSNMFDDGELFGMSCNCISNCDVKTFLKIWRRTRFKLDAKQLKILLSCIEQNIDDLNTCSQILTEPTFLSAVHLSKETTLCLLSWLTTYLLNFEYTTEWPTNVLQLIDHVQPELYRDLNKEINRPKNVVSLVLKNKDLLDCKVFKEFKSFVLNLKDIVFIRAHFHINISYARYIDSTPQHWIHQIISSTPDTGRLNEMFENEFQVFAISRHLSIDQVVSTYFGDRKHLKKVTTPKLKLLLGKIKSTELRTKTILTLINFIAVNSDLEAYILSSVSYQYVDDVKYTLEKQKLKMVLNKHEILVPNYHSVSKPTVITWIKYILKMSNSTVQERIDDCISIISVLNYMDIPKSFIYFTLLGNNLGDVEQYKEMIYVAKKSKDPEFVIALNDTVKFLEYKINHTDNVLGDEEIDSLRLTVNCLKHMGENVHVNPKVLKLINQVNRDKSDDVENATYYEYTYNKDVFYAKCSKITGLTFVGSYFEEKIGQLSEEGWGRDKTVETIRELTNLVLSEEENVKLLDIIKHNFYTTENPTKSYLSTLLECAIKLLKTDRKCTNLMDKTELVLSMVKFINFIDTAVEQTDKMFIEEGLEIDKKTCNDLQRYIGLNQCENEQQLVENIYNHGHIILSQHLLQHTLSKSTFYNQPDIITHLVANYNVSLCEKLLRCESDDAYFGLYAMCQLNTATLIEIVQIIRRVNPESMQHLTRILTCYMEIHDEDSYITYLERQANLTKWCEVLTAEKVELNMGILKGAAGDSAEYKAHVREVLVKMIKSGNLSLEAILQFCEELCAHLDTQMICDLILTNTIPEVTWNSSFYDKIDYALEHESPPPNLSDLIGKVDSYNYEGIQHLLNKLKLCPELNTKRYTKYSSILSVILNYTRNSAHGSLPECPEPESTSPHQHTRLPFHDTYKKAFEGRCWYMFEREVGDNVGDIVEIYKLLKLDPEFFYTSAIKNVGLKYRDDNDLMRYGSALLQHVESPPLIYKASKWLSQKITNDDYKDEMMAVCLKALNELVQEEDTAENQQLYSIYRRQYNLFRCSVYLKEYSLHNDTYTQITTPSLLIKELYSAHYANPHVHAMTRAIQEIQKQCQYDIDLPSLKRHLAGNWLLHDKASDQVVDTNFKKAVAVLQSFNDESIASSLLEMIYYHSRADITSHSQIRFILALLMTVTRQTIETQDSISNLTELLCTLVFINRLPKNIQFTSDMFRKSEKYNLVRSMLSRYGAQYLQLCQDICITYHLEHPDLWYMLLDACNTHSLPHVLQMAPPTLDTTRYWNKISDTATLRDMVLNSSVVVPNSVLAVVLGT